MKWIITSDWQAAFSNLEFCKIAHDQELEIIQKYGIKGFIDDGDLKDAYNPIDGRVTEFQLDRFKAVRQLVPNVIVNLGNHDRYGQHADEINWLGVFKNLDIHRVTVPRWIDFDTISWACIPFRKTSQETIAAAAKLAKRKKFSGGRRGLLFHNDVRGACYDNVQTRTSTSHITLKSLRTKKYDIAFGGHIHKRQKLSANTWFVGNPFATDWGEIDQEKAFLIYDDETNEVKIIKSKVPGLYSWRVAKNFTGTFPIGTRIKAVVHCDATSDYHSALDKVASAIEHKYPDCIAYVIPKFENDTTEQTVVVDPDASDATKIKSYVKATIPADLAASRHALTAYLVSTLGKIGGLTRQSGKLYFENIRAKNVLTYSDVKLSYCNRGIALVKGNNKDWMNHSNGAGKTNLLSLIPIALFGTTFKGQKNDKWANRFNKNKATVKLDLKTEQGQTITIIRGRRPAKLQMLIDGKDVSTGLRGVGKKETQGQLEEFTGYTFDTLANSVYIDTSVVNTFLTGTNKDRADLIYKFLNLERFERAQKEVTKDISAVSRTLERIESNREVAKARIEEIDSELESLKEKSKQVDTEAITKRYFSAKKRIKKANKELTRTVKRATKTIKTYRLRLEVAQKTAATLFSEIAVNTQKIRHAEKELTAAEKAVCPTCGAKLSAAKIKAKKAHAEHTIGSLTEINRQKDELKRANEKRVKDIHKDIITLEKLIDDSEARMQKNTANLMTTRSAYMSVKKIADLDAASKEKLIHKKHKQAIVVKSCNASIKHMEEEKAFLEYAWDSFSRDGLPSFLSKLVIPLLNRAAERYSKLFVDKEIQVVFELEKNQITPHIVNAHGGNEVDDQSGGEKAWSGIITSFALREISHPTNLLILDEPGNGLDPESAKTFGEKLPLLKKYFETVLVVTHNPYIAAALDGDNAITVVKQNKISRIIA